MTTLVLTNARSGAELDRVTLVGGRLEFRTGRAKTMFDALRRRQPDWGDERMFQYLAGWSNGYLQLREET